MKIVTTACPRNCYSTCSMRLTLRNGKIRLIEAHPHNRATPEGICLKGLSYVERVYSRDRLLKPLKRRLKTDSFEAISWDDTFSLIAEKLRYFKKKYGPRSVLYYAGSGTKGLLNAVGMNFWRLYGGCTTTYGDLCWPAGLEATRLTLGENKHNAPWDIETARLIILWGKNSAETNVHQMYYIDKAKQQGAKLIVIDPRRTQTSERAELLIQPRPGTDGLLALTIAKLLIENQWIDQNFIKDHVSGFDSFSAMVKDCDLGVTAEVTEVPESYIKQLAEDIGTLKPLSINAGFGMQRYTNSGQTIRAIIALLALTGNIGKSGAGWIYANLQSAIFDAVKDPLAFYPPAQDDGLIRISISTALLGQHILETKNPPLKMLWVERGNPVTQNPDTNTLLKALRTLEFRLVIEQFMTDTAKEADLILPAKTMFEQADVIGAYWHPYIQLKQKVIEPPQEVKPESEIYYLLARQLGFSPEQLAGKIPAPGDEAIQRYLNDKLKAFPQITLERLRQGPLLTPDHQEIAFADFKFSTPSGKIELLSEEAKTRWGLDPLPRYKEPIESVRSHGNSENKYPLYLLTPNTKNRIHSQFNNLKMIRQFSEKPLLHMHPEDAAKRSIKPGNQVRIFNDRGEIRLQVQIDFGIKIGCIVVTNGWWISEGGTVNFCSLGRETDMGFGAAFHDNLVEVERIDGCQ